MIIKVAIAEDHPMTIKGIKETLLSYPHISITGTYSSAEALMPGLEGNLPDVLLLDIQLPDKTGDQLAPLLRELYPDMRILVLTNFDSPLYASKLLGNYIMGYLIKTTDEKTLITAIECVNEGKQFLEKDMRERVDNLSSRKSRVWSQKTALTPKEKEVLQLIVNGENSQEIAKKLFLSTHTVNNYRNNILLKMGVKNMAELTKKAILLGWVEF